MDQIQNGWFHEGGCAAATEMWPGQRFGLEVKQVLHHERSEYQDIVVFDSTTYGRVLILDGVIQLTERDEAAYQEAIVNLPMFAHPNPKSVLIVGGGDGGALREVCRHKNVEKIVMCEIDKRVVEVSKQFFGNTMATAFNDPRVELLFMDAAIYMAKHKESFDVIIVDSSDPVGPAETLYSSAFYKDMHSALRAGGVVCTQGECQWLHLDLIQRVMSDAKQLYPVVDYAYSCVPTYPSGQIGYLMAQKGGNCPLGLRTPKRAVPEYMKPQLKYYTEAIHTASFILPAFAENRLAEVGRPRSKPVAAPSLAEKIIGSATLTVGAIMAVGLASALVTALKK